MPDPRSDPPFAVQREAEGILAWSTHRLPFEPFPQPWMQEFRAEIRAAIHELPVDPEKLLHAAYAARDEAFCDLENVLLYNVGTPQLRRLLGRGVRIERSNDPTNPSATTPLPRSHGYWYGSIPAGCAPGFGRSGRILATLTAVPMPRPAKPVTVWAAIREYTEPPPPLDPSASTWLGVVLLVAAPAQSAGTQLPNISELIKPLLDGVVSALHAHDGQQLGEVTHRLVAQSAGEPDRLSAMLTDRRWAQLGTRRLLWPHGHTVQWNPADDRCQFVEVTLDSAPTDHNQWELSGHVFELIPTNAALMAWPADGPRPVPVPDNTADEWQLIQFALTYDPVPVLGNFERVTAVAHPIRQSWERDRTLPNNLDKLRISLYMAQRAHRHSQTDLSDDHFVRALVASIRALSGGYVLQLGGPP